MNIKSGRSHSNAAGACLISYYAFPAFLPSPFSLRQAVNQCPLPKAMSFPRFRTHTMAAFQEIIACPARFSSAHSTE